jgi:hypothetical protein
VPTPLPLPAHLQLLVFSSLYFATLPAGDMLSNDLFFGAMSENTP